MTQRDEVAATISIRTVAEHEVEVDIPTSLLRDFFAGQALSSIPLRCWDDLETDVEKMEAWASGAFAVANATLVARSPAQGEGETDPKERLPRDADIILEALNEYDAFMLDDDYDVQACFTRVMKRMRERYEMVDRSPQPDQTELLREAVKVIALALFPRNGDYGGPLCAVIARYEDGSEESQGHERQRELGKLLAKIQKELGDD